MNRLYTPFRTLVLVFIALFTTSLAFAQPDSDAGSVPQKDQVILDDLIVDGSACIGFDCVNGESFGFDTIRIKENNLRIKAQDTSSTASFPTQDWQITFNDSANGGANKFSIDAISPSSSTPFTIEAGSNSHALYVDDGGRIGFGTNTPVVELHVKDGDTPTLRLEQDGSSGFTPQTWDLAGNETNFFVRDVTMGSKLPFRIRPGAPTSSIDVAADGDVGIGTGSPGTTNKGDNAQVHIRTTTSNRAGILIENASSTDDTREMLELKNNGPTRLVFDDSGDANDVWIMSANNANQFNIRELTVGSSATGFLLSTNGALSIAGDLTANGIVTPSDYRLKNDVKSFEDGLDVVLKMDPISFKYNGKAGIVDKQEKIGLGAQDLQKIAPYLVNDFTYVEEDTDGNVAKTEEYLKINVGAIPFLLVNAIQEQNVLIQEKDERITALETQLDELQGLNEQFETLQGKFDELADQIAFRTEQDVILGTGSKAVIGQNFPNPYGDETVIEYFLPSNVQSAEIQFHDVTGKLLKSVSLDQLGKGQLNLKASDLPQGQYTYTLIVDQQLVDSKQMVINR